jgi:hypothetical protein
LQFETDETGQRLLLHVLRVDFEKLGVCSGHVEAFPEGQPLCIKFIERTTQVPVVIRISDAAQTWLKARLLHRIHACDSR